MPGSANYSPDLPANLRMVKDKRDKEEFQPVLADGKLQHVKALADLCSGRTFRMWDGLDPQAFREVEEKVQKAAGGPGDGACA